MSEKEGEQDDDKCEENEECKGEIDRSLQGCHAPHFRGPGSLGRLSVILY